jgi:hypothetical protein
MSGCVGELRGSRPKAGDPTGSGLPSPSGTFIQPWGPDVDQIFDGQGNIWTLANLEAFKNGTWTEARV